MSWKWFTLEEFKCKGVDCCGGENRIDPAFVDKLDALRDRIGFPLPVNSGYRCPLHNARVSTTGASGPHTTGHAVDLEVDRGKAYAVLKEAPALGFTGIGVAQKGASRYIHLDDLPNAPGQPRPTCWSY